MHKSIFNASFEESKRVVDKKILTAEGAGIGDSSSMKFRDRIIIFFIGVCFFGILSYGIGIGMPEAIAQSKPEDIKIISYSSVDVMKKIVSVSKYFTIATLALFIFSLSINLLPKKNYAHQLLVGVSIVINMVLCSFTAVLPLVLTLTIDGTGWLGLVIQLIVSISILMLELTNRKAYFKDRLWSQTERGQNWSMIIVRFFKRYGGILCIAILINRYFLHIGEFELAPVGIFGVIYGWTLIIMMITFTILLYATIPQFFSIYYFIKYAEQYREYFKVSDEQWYGKRKAKKLAKKRKRIKKDV